MTKISSTRKTTFLSIALTSVSLVLAIVSAEIILRLTILEDKEYQNEAIAFTMNNLRTDKDVGFLWKNNLDKKEAPGWYDQEVFPLVTDENGFFNPREALDKKRRKTPVNIVGIGDSFMHGATYEFYDFFKQKNMFFYNMSMSRHCPPQYNIILKKYALPLKPDWILYGIYENDFDETLDFESWQQSRSDWFTYHSGTWFGAPVQLPFWRSILEEYAPGISTLEKRVRRQFKLPPVPYNQAYAVPVTEEEKAEKIYRYIVKAYEMASQDGISFLCFIIPPRDIDSHGNTGRSYHYNIVYEKLRNSGVPVLDLRPAFNNHPQRLELYYKLDAHWNREGIQEAEKLLFDWMKEK